jgi:thermostable 8-oxoguanine DNA glycosylase
MPGIRWGNYCQLFTPSFWKLQYLLSDFNDDQDCHRLSSSIIEEIVMCMLGGYGIPSEMGILAFKRLKEKDLCRKGVSYENIYELLHQPFEIANGKRVRYRFASQKSKYVYLLLNQHNLCMIPTDCDLSLRTWLLNIEGIGLKTASWITRNWLKSNKVAILDVHLLRAGVLTGFFEANVNVNRHYLKLEKRYLDFCYALEVLPSNMDAVIWNFMKQTNKLAIRQINS